MKTLPRALLIGALAVAATGAQAQAKKEPVKPEMPYETASRLLGFSMPEGKEEPKERDGVFRFALWLRIFGVLFLGGLLFACSQPVIEECGLCSRVEPNQTICAPEDNIAVCFFAVAIPQGDHSPEPVRDALKDALTLPFEALRAKRYANYQMEPNQWTFEEVIGHTFTGEAMRKNGDMVGPDDKGFLQAIKQPEARPVLKKLLADFEEGVREYKELEEFRSQNRTED